MNSEFSYLINPGEPDEKYIRKRSKAIRTFLKYDIATIYVIHNNTKIGSYQTSYYDTYEDIESVLYMIETEFTYQFD